MSKVVYLDHYRKKPEHRRGIVYAFFFGLSCWGILVWWIV